MPAVILKLAEKLSDRQNLLRLLSVEEKEIDQSSKKYNKPDWKISFKPAE